MKLPKKNLGFIIISLVLIVWSWQILIQRVNPPDAGPNLLANPAHVRQRFGVTVSQPPLEADVAAALGVGWYLTWSVAEAPNRPHDVEFWQMIRLSETEFKPDKATIRKTAEANPGSIWLIGNEPDVKLQDNVTPARYAEWYHDLYYLLKEHDPSANVAIGGITQPTPLRLQYLEKVLAAYETRYQEVMPVDIWNIHNFILPEKRDSWGVDIPPGLPDNQGALYDIEDHDNLQIFEAQLINFRQWMADHDQRHKPLVISEYGILMPAEYGFDPERVQRFMVGTYELMLNATDQEIGYPADNYRLVQRWAWFSLNSSSYPTGNFIDLDTGEFTDLGQVHQDFVINLP